MKRPKNPAAYAGIAAALQAITFGRPTGVVRITPVATVAFDTPPKETSPSHRPSRRSRFRITSYNVCYTKLLRSATDRVRSVLASSTTRMRSDKVKGYLGDGSVEMHPESDEEGSWFKGEIHIELGDIVALEPVSYNFV